MTESTAAAAIEDLLRRYADLHQKGDHEGVAGLFATDAELTVEPFEGAPTSSLGTRRGRVEILEFFARGGSGPAPPGLTLGTSNSVIDADVAAGTATARSDYTLVGPGQDGPSTVLVAGRYHDRFRRENGQWCFASRRYETTLMSDAFRRVTAQ
jgi:3-phenylpropionate/cinnamic acid dioxygenase small subunit